jgi:hypothetical protein
MDDANTALARLCRAMDELLSHVEGVPDPAFCLRPPGEEWSLAETVEHVALATQATLARLRQLFASPLAPDVKCFDDGKIDAEMFRMDGPAPALAVPTGRFATRAAGVAALRAACDGIAEWVAQLERNPREFGLPHPVFGNFDGVQWILFAAAHADNHAPQLRAIRARLALAPAS